MLRNLLVILLILLSGWAYSQVSGIASNRGPCEDCFEVEERRTDTTMYYLSESDPDKFYLVYFPSYENFTSTDTISNEEFLSRATVTSTNSTPVLTGAFYNPTCAAILACTYSVTVPTPANSEITDVRFSFDYGAGAGCWLGDAVYDVDYLGCTSGFWGCALIGGGTCTGADLSMFAEIGACIPAPSCAPYDMDFDLNFYRSCIGPAGCATLGCVYPLSDFSVTIEGETVDNTALAGGSVTSIAVGCDTDVLLDAGAVYGVPAYDYLWSNGETTATQTVNHSINGTYTYSVLVTDACGQTTTSSVDVVVSGCSATLPVELVHFQGKNFPEGNKLTWETLSETDNEKFIIERSSDGLNWENIGEIMGAGNSSTKIDYEFLDDRPIIGMNYYRLKQVDFNGSWEYSDIISIDLRNKFVLYPNPAEDQVQLVLEEDKALPLSLQITNAQGTIVYRDLIQENFHEIDLSELSSGVYFVRLFEDGSLFSTEKLVVR